MNTIIVKLAVILITGPYGMTKAETTEMYTEVRDRLRVEVGVELKLKSLKRRSDLYKQFGSLNSRLQRYLSWKLWLTANGRLKAGQLTYLVFPPMYHTDGKRYISGYASSICSYKKFRTLSTGNAQMFNQDGAKRFQHSTLVMLHELAHQLGATHQDYVPNVMHGNALAYLGNDVSHWSLPILPVSVQQIRKCVD